jgi:hypothetical protein
MYSHVVLDEKSRVLMQIMSKAIEELVLSIKVHWQGRDSFVPVLCRFPWDVLEKCLARPEFANLTRLDVSVIYLHAPNSIVISQVESDELKQIIEKHIHAFKHIFFH